VATDIHPGELLDRVQELSARVDELPDPRARELTQELVSVIIAMYGDGLGRIMATIEGAREAGATILDELAQDGVVASLLLIHDLYPVPLEDRVMEALDTVRPYMESHGGNVELVSLQNGVAKLVLQGSCNGCSASRATLELAIKQALDEHAPDLAGLEVEGVTEPAAPPGGFVLPVVQSGLGALPLVHSGASELPMAGELPTGEPPSAGEQPARWIPLNGEAELGVGELRALQTQGVSLLLARVDGSLLAYRNCCAACGEPLHDGELDGGMLRCASCGADFDLPRAGRAAGGEPLQLTPVPLLEAGGIRVAV
jgi:Fe-S cluster biogenesis protein NfuA/nitrite reductase/ring-hydroxylating ferredoxin subunit